MTERELVYSIIETLNNYEYNNDNRLNERLVRNLIHIYRAEAIRKYYKDGQDLTDECYQELEINFSKLSDVLFKADIPKIIELSERKGLSVNKYGTSIPIVNRTVFAMSREDDYPIIKRGTSSTLEIKIPFELNDYISASSEKGALINNLISEVLEENVVLTVVAILVNPSDDVNYNWLSDVFPFPAEMLDELKTTILRKEFGIASQIKSDEVQNARVDNIRYHENTNLEQ